MQTWAVPVFEAVLGLCLILMSPRQPFPRPAKRFGTFLILISLLGLMAEGAPRPMELQAHLIIMTVIGGAALIRGIDNMVNTRREVLVAPFAGLLFCVGCTGLFSLNWQDLSTFEHWAAFFSVLVLGAGQTWLVFRGLLIGRLPLAWSQAGFVELQRGRLHGQHGAIECFEKAWDLEEEHLNPMSQIALEKIHRFLGEDEIANDYQERFLVSGGIETVSEEWINAIEEALEALEPINTAS